MTVSVPANTNRELNRAPWGLGANFIDFTNAAGSLTLTFDGANGFAWRAFAIVTSSSGRTAVFPIALDGGSAGSITLDGMDSRWSKATLAVTIADPSGIAVPYSYGAMTSRAAIVAN